MEEMNEIEISVLKGDKLFNENTPIVVNVFSPQPETDEKKCNADLICVIDISGSMSGDKIDLVKQSLKILVGMMDKNDRLALILFSNFASIEYNLDYMTEENKKILTKVIEEIDASGGTNILSGLEQAVEILKKEKEKEKVNEDRVSSLLLLSDGRDNFSDDIQLTESLKKLTKGLNLSFTLNSFGYGYDHDPKIMNKLANIRDGSFFLVEDYKKVAEYFVAVLGGCVSVISKKAELNVKMLNENCKIIKIFGGDDLYSHQLKPDFFTTTMLQFICGKEYTFVFEIKIDENNVKIGDELLDINFIYDDIKQNKSINKNYKYKYQLTDIKITKANEEYIRCQVYFILGEALKLRQNYKIEEAKKMLINMKDWLTTNYKGDNKSYLEDVKKTINLFSDEHTFKTVGITYVSSNNREKISKRSGNTLIYNNRIQSRYSQNARQHFNKNI